MSAEELNVEVKDDFIERQSKASPIQALSELIWNGPVTELFRSFDLVFCHKGETSWHSNQPRNSAQKQFVWL